MSDFLVKAGNVVFHDEILSKLDADTFELLYTTERSQQFGNAEGYLRDKSGIWWFDSTIKTKVKLLEKKQDSVKVFSDKYAGIGDYVYQGKTKIPNSDPHTFVVLEDTPYFAKDKNQVYAHSEHYGLQIFKYADPETFLGCGWNQFAVDRDNLYHFYSFVRISNDSKWVESPLQTKKLTLRTEEFNLRELYPDLKGYWWCDDYPHQPTDLQKVGASHYVNESSVYYCDDEESLTLLRGVDPNDFEVLDDWYSRSGERVFYQSTEMDSKVIGKLEVLGFQFLKDEERIYFRGKEVDFVDYESFEPLKNPHSQGDILQYARDKGGLFTSDTKKAERFGIHEEVLVEIKDSDPETLEFLSEDWAKDKGQVYCWGSVQKNLDPSTFEVVHVDGPNHWAKDRNGVYNSNARRTVKGLDGETYEHLNNYWGKDKNCAFCYYNERVIKAADGETFTVLDDKGTAEDKGYRFWIEDHELKKKKK